MNMPQPTAEEAEIDFVAGLRQLLADRDELRNLVTKQRYRINDLRDEIATVEAQRKALRDALTKVLRYCVRVDGFPDKNKGRTKEQQDAFDAAIQALSLTEKP